MTSWLHYPFSHPWMPTLKRKLSDDDSEGDSHSSQASSSQCSSPRVYHSPKRRRYDLSRNLSRLSLLERVYPIIEEPQQQQYMGNTSTGSVSQTSPTMDEAFEEMPISIDIDVDTPGMSIAIVEEPVEPVVPSPRLVREVRMRNSSSYEPEKDRIVVTDLDSSESESEPDDSNSFAISSTVLSKLKTADRTFIPKQIPRTITGTDALKAVVLYRPSPWAASNSQERDTISHTGNRSPSYEDVMETE